MSYSLLSGYDENEDLTPRYLTTEEIDEILADFPEVKSSDQFTSMIIRAGILRHLRYQLEEIELIPLKEARDAVKDSIWKRFKISRTQAGSALNTISSDAIAATLTQMVLDTFKTAGSVQTVGSGVQGMRSIFNTVSNRSDAMCSVHFNIPVSYLDVINMRALLVHKTVLDFMIPNEYSIDELKDIERPWWYKIHESVHGPLGIGHTTVMRLKFDRLKMYEHRVTLDMIAKAISSPTSITASVVCIASPFSEAIIDIIPDDFKIKNIASKKLNDLQRAAYFTRQFLDRILTDHKDGLSTLRIKGIPGIKNITPVEISIEGMMSSAEKINPRMYNGIRASQYFQSVPDPDMSRVWRVPVNIQYARKNGLEENNLFQLLQMSGMTILYDLCERREDEKFEFLYIYTGDNSDNPNSILSDFINANSENDQVSRLCKYVFGQTTGSNLSELLKIRWVDRKKTVSNNIHEMASFFGVEASRSYAIFELQQIMEGKVSINSRHVTVIMDSLYNLGIPVGVTYHGIARQKQGPLFLATTQRPIEALTKAAPYGKSESVLSPTVSTMTGEVAAIGSNYSAALLTPEAVKEYREKLELQSEKARKKAIMIATTPKRSGPKTLPPIRERMKTEQLSFFGQTRETLPEMLLSPSDTKKKLSSLISAPLTPLPSTKLDISSLTAESMKAKVTELETGKENVLKLPPQMTFPATNVLSPTEAKAIDNILSTTIGIKIDIEDIPSPSDAMLSNRYSVTMGIPATIMQLIFDHPITINQDNVPISIQGESDDLPPPLDSRVISVSTPLPVPSLDYNVLDITKSGGTGLYYQIY